MHCRVSPLCYSRCTTTVCLKFSAHSFRLAPFLPVKVSAGGSFYCNYATDTFYGNYASGNVLHFCRF